MKRLIGILSFSLLGLAGAPAQGTFQFTVNLSGANAAPSNDSLYTAQGTLTLNGDLLAYSIGRSGWDFLPSSAGIYGPASPSQNGNLIFDFGNYGLTPNPPTLSYLGAFTLTSQQINKVKSGLWYVTFNSSSYPNGEIRGQITPVPEPSVLVLFGLGTGGLA